MISEALIIMSSMRGGYANVGTTVHTLFRMNRRPLDGSKKVESNERSVRGYSVTAADAQSNSIESVR
jgi:hypothetical protein